MGKTHSKALTSLVGIIMASVVIVLVILFLNLLQIDLHFNHYF